MSKPKATSTATVTDIGTKRRGRPPGKGLFTVIHDDSDEWKTSVPITEYDSSEFYVRATDDRGHMDKTSVALPQGVLSLVSKIVAAYPYYSSTQAFIRDAIMHRMAMLAMRDDLDDDIKFLIDVQQFNAALDTHAETINQLRAMIDNLKATGEEAQRTRDWRRLADTVERGDEFVEKLREPYHGEMEAMLRPLRAALKQARDRGEMRHWSDEE